MTSFETSPISLYNFLSIFSIAFSNWQLFLLTWENTVLKNSEKIVKKLSELYEKKINNFCLLLFFCKVDIMWVKNYWRQFLIINISLTIEKMKLFMKYLHERIEFRKIYLFCCSVVTQSRHVRYLYKRAEVGICICKQYLAPCLALTLETVSPDRTSNVFSPFATRCRNGIQFNS